ncbi:MAG TPA: OB-fold nucleic acid binding domain-containing protein, partial [Ktedonobacterales bacterium]|nr:OB-fold nucleic acid binding domain-containing protein [Ktedonobacterales bacterium]
RLNRSEAQRRRVSQRVRAYQAARDPEEQRQHMRRMHARYPHLTRNGVAAMHERVKWLFANDSAWKKRLIAKSIANTRACYDTGPGYGRCSIASNGMWCASQPERDMCEWLIEQGIAFEMHKVLGNGRICDFYFNGIYWEMDGMDRDARYFAEKYGDLPYVVVTPEDFKPIVLQHLGVAHAANGDPIVAIEPCGEAMTYDVEMAPDGPLNYIANRIVSHNSHAAAYGFVAYQTAYLKATYTAEFMAATLTTEAGDAKKVVAAIEECRRMGVEVRPPDINKSESGFTVEAMEPDAETGEPRWAVRFGLLAIRNVGSRPIDALLETRREKGPFRSLADIFARTDGKSVTRGAVECLIKAGALDSLGRRSQLLAALDRAVSYGQQQRKMREIGQNSLFGALSDESHDDFTLPDVPDHSQEQLLAWEKELLNLYLSAHPLSHIAAALKRRVTTYTALLNEEWAGQKITLGGRVTEIRRIITKRGDTMLIVQLEDMQGTVPVTVFPKTYAATSETWREDAVLLVTGTVRFRDDDPEIICEGVEAFELPPDEADRKEYLVRIAFKRQKNSALDVAHLQDVLTALNDFPGHDRYEFVVRNGKWEARLTMPPGRAGIRYCPELHQQLEGLLGPGAVLPQYAS